MPAPSLRELEEEFFQALARDPGAPAPAAALLDVVAPGARLSPAARVGVYADMYFWRLLDVAREDFPRTAAVLGEDAFRTLVHDYLVRHPSTHPSLRHLGGGLPAFLAGAPPSGAPPFLPDLARLEWTRVEVFDASDAPALRLEDLRAVPADEWPALRFAPVPALAVVASDWPLDRAWQEAGGETPPAALPRERSVLRVWRDGFLVHHARVDAREEEALAHLVAGDTFAEICDGFDDPAAAGALLLRWLEDGIVLAPVR
jgi:hypothetical protein